MFYRSIFSAHAAPLSGNVSVNVEGYCAQDDSCQLWLGGQELSPSINAGSVTVPRADIIKSPSQGGLYVANGLDGNIETGCELTLKQAKVGGYYTFSAQPINGTEVCRLVVK